ncbi:MAG: hypothetical protein ACLU78_00210 [Clostridium sp.]
MMESKTDCTHKRPTGGCGGVASTEQISTKTVECRSVTIKQKTRAVAGIGIIRGA